MIRAKLAAGQLPPGAKTLADAHRMIFNDRLDATVALVIMAVAVLVIVVSVREWLLRAEPPEASRAPRGALCAKCARSWGLTAAYLTISVPAADSV